MTDAHRAARALFLAAALAVALPASADDIDDAQVWLAINAAGSIKGKLEGQFDVNTRHFDNATHLGHVQVRGLLGWRFSKDVLLGAGYSYVYNESQSGRVVEEHRIFQQANFPIARIGKAQLVGRTRLEQRTFSNIDGVALRLRQQVRLNVPLEGPKGLRAIIYTEPFFLLNRPTGSAPTGLNQIRSFAGLGIPVTGNSSLEAGYMNQAIFPGQDRFNHVLNMGFSIRF
jgi:hypothetical protein